jgi:ethanolamine utilization microcompartment shell protein EutS
MRVLNNTQEEINGDIRITAQEATVIAAGLTYLLADLRSQDLDTGSALTLYAQFTAVAAALSRTEAAA